MFIFKVYADWDVMLWPPGFVNAELQAYVNDSENIFIENGILNLRAIKKGLKHSIHGTISSDTSLLLTKVSGERITSGRVESKRWFSPLLVSGKKIRVEFTARIPTVMGAWPALWMLGKEVTKLQCD